MARQKLTRVRRDRAPGVSSPAQQDEADVVAEVGAEFNEELNEFVATEEDIRKIGAVDAESVIENRRLDDIVGKKRANMPGVPFNAGDLQTKYETLIRVWPPNTLEISVKRLTGSPIQRMITSQPRSGVELYDALMEIHGQDEEAKYELKFFDKNGKEFRSTGQITMPDTRAPKQPQQGSPMQNNPPPYYPPGYAQPPPGYPPPGYPPQAMPLGYPPPGYPPQGYAPQAPPPQAAPQQPQQQAAPVAQPQAPQPPFILQTPAGPDLGTMFEGMRQLMSMFQEMQRQNPAMQPPAAPPPPQYIHVPQQVAPPPLPPAGADMPTMLAWVKQMYELFQGMQPPPQPPPPPPPPPQRGERYVPQQMRAPQEFNPMGLGAPPMQSPPGTIWVQNVGFVPLVALAAAMGAPPPNPEPTRGGPMHRGAPYRPAYYPQGEREAQPPPGYQPQGYPPQGYQPQPDGGPYRSNAPPYEGGGAYRPNGAPQAPQQQQTPAEQFRQSVTYIRGAMATLQELTSLLPQQGGAPEAIEVPEEDDSPVQIIDAGPAKIVVNKKDGTMRGWETAWANSGDLLKWFGEQREKLQEANARRQGGAPQQPPPQQLPAGYVEVRPGYQPPHGYVAVPVDYQQPLPPPPEYVPPPIQSTPTAGRGWGMPPISGQGGT